METEIEIKLFFSRDFELELFKKISAHHSISSKKQFLHNVYFDTVERKLRKMDMGLRVRSCENKSVQTIKTSGRVIGGLHQRPEYNEPIVGLRPQLARFNSKIWPAGCDLKLLENELVPIFSTDFERQTWLLEMPDSTLIEVAYDQGSIESNHEQMTICEIELELVKGDEKQLFVLCNDIARLPQVRLANVSKAQRGYMLADDLSFTVKPLTCPPLDESMSVEQLLLTNLQHGLRHIQYHEHCYLVSEQDNALKELLKGIKFLHQNLKLFKNTTPLLLEADWLVDLHWLARSFSWFDEYFTYQSILQDKGYYIRKLPRLKTLMRKLEVQQNELPKLQSVADILISTRYCLFILKLTDWLIQFEKNTFSSEKPNTTKLFAQQSLDFSDHELKQAVNKTATLSTDQVLAYQGLLETNLLTGLSVANLFHMENSSAFYSPWLDIKEGMKELAMLNIIADIATEEEGEIQIEYFRWIKRKQDTLLHALEQSKQQALIKELFWHNES
jgi:triphosphatase